MLKRSPKSKYISIASGISIVIITITIISTVSTWRDQTIEHGERKNYYLLRSNLLKGEKIQTSKLESHQMFANDAPKNAITQASLNKNKVLFANTNIRKNSILLKNMTTTSIDATLENNQRIIFIPTTDIINIDLAQYSDIIATIPDGFGSDVIAEDAEIIFDSSLTSSSSATGVTENQDPGYYVIVSSDEALAISTALVTGELHMALKQK